jgi:hypothetical protein
MGVTLDLCRLHRCLGVTYTVSCLYMQVNKKCLCSIGGANLKETFFKGQGVTLERA